MNDDAEFERLASLAVAALSKPQDTGELSALAILEGLRRLSRHHADARERFEELLNRSDKTFLELVNKLPMHGIDNVPIVLMKQHSVGHGGFHTGALGINGPSLVWVYDCGALRTEGKERLGEAIESFAAKLSAADLGIDFLFVSHFDADHISGLSHLMSRARVKTVVLPYMDEIDRLAVRLSAMVDDALTSDLEEVTTDPASWFRGRGAERVVQIGQDDGDTPPGLLSPEAAGALREISGGTVLLDPKNRPIAAGDGAVAPSGSGWVLGRPGLSDWVFVPFVNPARYEARVKLLRHVARLLHDDVESTELAKKAVRRIASDAQFVLDLKAAYRDSGLSDSNAVSLSLYAGPIKRQSSYYRVGIPARGSYTERFGWLLTGDAKLKQVRRRNRFLQFFDGAMPYISHFMLPHHGSQANFHEGLIKDVDEKVVLFACREVREGDEPFHEDVWDHVRHRRYHVVGVEKGKALREISGLSRLSGSYDLQRMVKNWI